MGPLFFDIFTSFWIKNVYDIFCKIFVNFCNSEPNLMKFWEILLLTSSSKSTSGPDGLPQIILKQMARQLTKPLVLLFWQLLQMGQLPDIWKIATVTPLFKKGSASDPGNYRPIYVTSVCCKVFKSAIKKPFDGILSFQRFYIFFTTWFSTHMSRSTCTNLIELLNNIKNGCTIWHLNSIHWFYKSTRQRFYTKTFT